MVLRRVGGSKKNFGFIKRVDKTKISVEDLPDCKLSQDVNEIIKKYEDVFHRIGCLQGNYSIKIDLSITPVVHPTISLMSRLLSC